MSLLGSLNAAVGGMNAQSASIGNISDNIANSQTVGFKETDTAFVDYLTDSSANTHSPGAVVARPEYTNTRQGALTQVSNPTSLAISGQGLFSVQRTSNGVVTDPTPYFTRVGDFSADQSGHLVNSTGFALDGWASKDPAGKAFDTTKLSPIVISKAPSQPVATSTIDLAANLPATPTTGNIPYTSTMQVNDASGVAHTLTLSWTPQDAAGATTTTPTQWGLSVTGTAASGAQTNFYNGSVKFFDGTNNTPASATTPAAITGTIASITPGSTGAAVGSGAAATLPLDFGLGPQAVSLKLGTIGTTSGVTQFAGSNYQVSTLKQDGSAQGNFSSVTIVPSGDVVISYDNGKTATVAKVPLTNFNNPDALQQQDGQAFTATLDSGNPNTFSAGEGGTGKMIVGAVEASNVDIAAQFTQMIVAQRAYTANTKVISTTNQLLQDTLNMVQG